MFHLGLDVSATHRALAHRGFDTGFDFTLCLDDRVAAHARRLGHRRLATATERRRHRTGDHPALHLVQVRQDGGEESREFVTSGLHQPRLHRAC